MSWLSFAAGLFVGVIFGAALLACCVVSGDADRIPQEWIDRQEGRGDG
jgi:hypothetical protein